MQQPYLRLKHLFLGDADLLCVLLDKLVRRAEVRRNRCPWIGCRHRKLFRKVRKDKANGLHVAFGLVKRFRRFP